MLATPAPDLAIEPETPGLFTRPDYYDLLARLRHESPIHPYQQHAWALSRYDDVRAVSRDPERFCSGRGVLMNDPKRDGAEIPGSILHIDPPEHASWRKVAARWFTPRAVAKLDDQVRRMTSDVLDDVPAGETIDFVDSVAAPIPVLVIADLLGVGDGDRADFRRWSDACIEGPDNHDIGSAAIGELVAFLSAHVQSRRAAPTDDLLSTLTQAEVEGRPIEDHEIVMYCLSLLVAGNETTRHLLSGGIAALAGNPDQQVGLANDDLDLAGVVEECLRWVTPIQCFGRTATTDVELGGQLIEAGDWVVMLYASANRDEAAFGPTAGAFDVSRQPNPTHLAFGFGEHLCLGAALARLEARTFFDEYRTRFGHCEIVGEPTMTVSTLVRGHHTLPVVLGRATPS